MTISRETIIRDISYYYVCRSPNLRLLITKFPLLCYIFRLLKSICSSRTDIYKNSLNFLVVMLCRYYDTMMAAECLRLSFSLPTYTHSRIIIISSCPKYHRRSVIVEYARCNFEARSINYATSANNSQCSRSAVLNYCVQSSRPRTTIHTHTPARKHSESDVALISADAPPRCGVIHNEN